MKTIICGTSTLLLLSWCTGVASANERSDANASCQETKPVVIWPHGPKAAPRVVTACEAKVS